MITSPIHFTGPGTYAEQRTVEGALERAEAHMSPLERTTLYGPWYAAMNEYDQGEKHLVVQRRGMGTALGGASAAEVARRIRSRWLAGVGDEE